MVNSVNGISSFFDQQLKQISPEIRDYLTGKQFNVGLSSSNNVSHLSELLKENAEDIATAEDVFEAVGDHIQGFADGLGRAEVDEICQKLFLLLHDG